MNVRRGVVMFLIILGVFVLLLAPQGTAEGVLLIAVGIVIELIAMSLGQQQ